MSTRKQIEDLVATVIWGEDTANATRLGTLVVDALVERDALVLSMTSPGTPEAAVAYTEDLRKRADEANGTAAHRALVIADLTRKLEIEKRRRIAAEELLPRGLVEQMRADEDRPANVMSPSGQSVLGMALPAKYEDRRTRMWGVRCYRNGVKAHLVHNEDGQLLVFSESVAVALAKPVVDIIDLRYEVELMP